MVGRTLGRQVAFPSVLICVVMTRLTSSPSCFFLTFQFCLPVDEPCPAFILTTFSPCTTFSLEPCRFASQHRILLVSSKSKTTRGRLRFTFCFLSFKHCFSNASHSFTHFCLFSFLPVTAQPSHPLLYKSQVSGSSLRQHKHNFPSPVSRQNKPTPLPVLGFPTTAPCLCFSTTCFLLQCFVCRDCNFLKTYPGSRQRWQLFWGQEV